jgi:hypothetical protein
LWTVFDSRNVISNVRQEALEHVKLDACLGRRKVSLQSVLKALASYDLALISECGASKDLNFAHHRVQPFWPN